MSAYLRTLARSERRVPAGAFDVAVKPGRHALDAAAGDAPPGEVARANAAWVRRNPEAHMRAIEKYLGPAYAAGCADQSEEDGDHSRCAGAYDSLHGLNRPEPEPEQPSSFADRWGDLTRRIRAM